VNIKGSDAWVARHNRAVQYPRGVEEGIVNSVAGWMSYAEIHKARYEQGIGEDYFLGHEWEKIGMSLLVLLNGDLGRLDGGTLDAAIRNALRAEGFDGE